MLFRDLVIHRAAGGQFGGSDWDRHKNEIVIAKTRPEMDFYYDGKISLFIAFDEVEIVGGKPAVGVLNRLASEVERILMAIEAEARRIGIVK